MRSSAEGRFTKEIHGGVGSSRTLVPRAVSCLKAIGFPYPTERKPYLPLHDPAREQFAGTSRRARGPAALDRSCSVWGAYGVYSPRRSLFLTPPPRESGAAMFARVSRLVPVIAQHCAALRSIAQHCARPRTCQPLRHHCCVLTLPCLSPSGPVAILYALVRTGSRLVRGGPQRSAAVRAVPHMTATQCPVLTHAVPGLSLGVSAAVPMRTGVHTAS